MTYSVWLSICISVDNNHASSQLKRTDHYYAQVVSVENDNASFTAERQIRLRFSNWLLTVEFIRRKSNGRFLFILLTVVLLVDIPHWTKNALVSKCSFTIPKDFVDWRLWCVVCVRRTQWNRQVTFHQTSLDTCYWYCLMNAKKIRKLNHRRKHDGKCFPSIWRNWSRFVDAVAELSAIVEK